MRLLILKGRTWWFKRPIPKPLRRHYGGKTAVTESTGTGDIRAAQRARDALEAQTTEDFALLASGKSVPGVARSPSDLGRAMREEITAAERDSAPGPLPHLSRADHLAMIADDQADSLKDKQDREAYLKALHGRESVDAFTDDYAAFRSDLRPKTISERRGLIRQFAEWATSERLTLPDVNRRAAGRYVAAKLQDRDPATARKHLTALTDYWDFLIRRGHVTPPAGDPNGNPWTDQLSTRRRSNGAGRGAQRGNAEERPFTAEEVSALLHGPARESFSPKLVPDILDVLTISLLSGLRQAEVVHLTVADVMDGKWIKVTAGKTDAAVRDVPMHSDLVPIFAKLTNGKKPTDPVFSDLAALDTPSDTFGKRFKRYREAAGVDEKAEGQRRSLVNFHSARRWFAHPMTTTTAEYQLKITTPKMAREELASTIKKAIASATTGSTYADVACILTGLLRDAALAEAIRTATVRAPVVQSEADRLDAAWREVWNSHLGGTQWAFSMANGPGIIGVGPLTLTRMRKCVRDLKAAGLEASGSWKEDRKRAQEIR